MMSLEAIKSTNDRFMLRYRSKQQVSYLALSGALDTFFLNSKEAKLSLRGKRKLLAAMVRELSNRGVL